MVESVMQTHGQVCIFWFQFQQNLLRGKVFSYWFELNELTWSKRHKNDHRQAKAASKTWPMIASIIWISRQLSITVVFGDDVCEVSIMPNHAYQNYEQLSQVFTAFKFGKFSCMFLGPLLACPVRVRMNALDSSSIYSSSSKLPKKIRISSLKTSFDTVSWAPSCVPGSGVREDSWFKFISSGLSK